MASIKDMAIVSHLVYDDGEIESENWNVWGGIINISSGFQAAVYKNNDTGEAVVAYRGSDEFGKDWTLDNLLIGIGRISPQAVSALILFEMFISNPNSIEKKDFLKFADANESMFKGDFFNRNENTVTSNVMVTGHSLGAALAAIVANKYKTYAVLFECPKILGLKTKDNVVNEYPKVRYESEQHKHDKKALSKILTPDEQHILTVCNIYNNIDTEIRRSYNWRDKKDREEEERKISSFCTLPNVIGSARRPLGKGYAAGTIINLSLGVKDPHSISQWSKLERYDKDGNYDPEKPINITEAQETVNKQKEDDGQLIV